MPKRLDPTSPKGLLQDSSTGIWDLLHDLGSSQLLGVTG